MSTLTKFVILAVERSGSDLLRGLLDSHPECFVGQEIFNEVYYEQGCVPWYVDPKTGRHNEIEANYAPELVDLRASNPGALIERLFDIARQEGYRAAGFKLMYYHGEKIQAARDHLASSPDVKILHLKRRNLLRRFLSLKRAQITNEWNIVPGMPRPPLPPVQLSAMECATEFNDIEKQQSFYDELFQNHPMMSLYYEDLAEHPKEEAARAAAFLGLTPNENLEIRFQKLAVDPLNEAIAGYPALKGVFQRWAGFFDE